MTALLLVHGRSQEMAAGADRSAAAVAAYVEGRKREWLGGLARGLTLAGHPPVRPDDVYYPFYGNVLADLIAEHERAGGRTPDLEAAPVAAVAKKATRTRDDLILEAAEELGFRPSRRLARSDPELVGAGRRRGEGTRRGRRGRLVRPAQAADRPRGAAVPGREDRDLGVDHPAVPARRRLLPRGRPHARRRCRRRCRPPSTAPSPTATSDMVVVAPQPRQHRRLRPVRRLHREHPGAPAGHRGLPAGLPDRPAATSAAGTEGADDRGVPAVVDPIPGAPAAKVWWLNVYDELDVVALVHPLASLFASGATAIRDERTCNPTDPHSIRTTCPTPTWRARSATSWPAPDGRAD